MQICGDSMCIYSIDDMAYMPYDEGRHITRIRTCEKIIWKGVKNMKRFDDYLSEQMQNEEFKKEYENMQPEFDVIRAIVAARTSQNLTQKELAERTGIHQADISKLENGTRNPSINLLKRLAEGMDMVLKIEFVPKSKI